MTPKERAEALQKFYVTWRADPYGDRQSMLDEFERAFTEAIEEERQTAKDTGVSFDELLESNLSEKTKHEIVEWLWARRIFDDDQYKLAMSRIEYIEKSKGD